MCICKVKLINSGGKKPIADDRIGISDNRYTLNLIRQDSKEYHISGYSKLRHKSSMKPKIIYKNTYDQI